MRYNNGVASLVDILDVERNLLSAELNRVDALRARRTPIADMVKALGGGWAGATDNEGTATKPRFPSGERRPLRGEG